jgi:hypothetical protein
MNIGIALQGEATDRFHVRRNTLKPIKIVRTELDDVVAVSCFSGDSAVFKRNNPSSLVELETVCTIS